MTRYVLDARTATNHFPGIGRYTVSLAQAMLPLLRQDERLILLRDPGQSSRWNLADLPTQIVDALVSPFSLKQQWHIPALLKQLQADLYHSPYFLMPYRPGRTTLLTLHDLIPLRYPQYYTLAQRLIFTVTIRLALRAADHCWAVSEATARDFQELLGLPAARVTAFPSAAAPYFRPQTLTNELRARLQIPATYLLYFGSNKPHKNLSHLVEAYSRLTPSIPPLVIAGVWEARYPEARQRATALGLGERVRFLGPVAEDDLPPLYSGAAAFLFPSEYEGFGLPVLEAMACGAPVICSDSSSLPEVAGDAALLVPPQDLEALVATMTRLLRDAELQAELRRRGLAQAARFSWTQTAQKTLELYRNLVT
jgi:alpha-1,3-rhamnosyl/mannosyltransferase